MGDHRASIKIEMEFHGVKEKADMYINYYPSECCSMDSRVVSFFRDVYERGMDSFNEYVADAERDQLEAKERAEFARLKAKFEVK